MQKHTKQATVALEEEGWRRIARRAIQETLQHGGWERGGDHKWSRCVHAAHHSVVDEDAPSQRHVEAQVHVADANPRLPSLRVLVALK